jgi:hypothetical protein
MGKDITKNLVGQPIFKQIITTDRQNSSFVGQ